MVKIVSVSEVTAGPTFEGKSALGTRLRLFCLFVFCLVCLFVCFFANLRSGVFFFHQESDGWEILSRCYTFALFRKKITDDRRLVFCR